MGNGWRRIALDETGANRENPGTRWDVSPKLDSEGYNVAVLKPNEKPTEPSTKGEQ